MKSHGFDFSQHVCMIQILKLRSSGVGIGLFTGFLAIWHFVSMLIETPAQPEELCHAL